MWTQEPENIRVFNSDEKFLESDISYLKISGLSQIADGCILSDEYIKYYFYYKDIKLISNRKHIVFLSKGEDNSQDQGEGSSQDLSFEELDREELSPSNRKELSFKKLNVVDLSSFKCYYYTVR
jgi:hypothetical protein